MPTDSIAGASSFNTGQLEKQLRIPEVAELTATSPATVRRWISRGELRAYYYGPRALRIDPADLRAMRKQVNPTTFDHVNGGGAR